MKKVLLPIILLLLVTSAATAAIVRYKPTFSSWEVEDFTSDNGIMRVPEGNNRTATKGYDVNSCKLDMTEDDDCGHYTWEYRIHGTFKFKPDGGTWQNLGTDESAEYYTNVIDDSILPYSDHELMQGIHHLGTVLVQDFTYSAIGVDTYVGEFKGTLKLQAREYNSSEGWSTLKTQTFQNEVRTDEGSGQ